MDADLRTDASPIPEVRTSAVGEEVPTTPPNVTSPNGKEPTTPLHKKMPEAMHLTGCSKIHIGPLYNCVDPASVRTPPPGATSPIHSFAAETKKAPPKTHVEALLRSSREMTSAEMDIVSNHIGYSWKHLGRQMEYSDGELDNIDADTRRLADKGYSLLSMWRDRESNNASVANLTRLLMTIKAYDVVMRLRP